MIDEDRDTDLRAALEALYFGYRSFTALPDAILAEIGLGRSHHRVLYFVRRDPGISVGALVDVLDVTKQAINRPIRDLETRGLLAIAPDPADGRVRRLTVTDEGAALEDRLTRSQTDLLRAVFDEVDPAAEAGWREVMARLAR